MKKAFFVFCLSLLSGIAFSHSPVEDFDYSIVFGGCFNNDVLSLKINNAKIFENIKVDNGDPVKKGNLSLTQANKKINLFYNGNAILKKKVKLQFYLDVDLTINNEVKKLQIDLRKGRVIVIDFCSQNLVSAKNVSIEQVQEPVVLL